MKFTKSQTAENLTDGWILAFTGLTHERKEQYKLKYEKLKENHPTLYREIKDLFSIAEIRNTLQKVETFDTGHGRNEKRTYMLSTDIDWFEDKKQWAGLKSFGMVESCGTRSGKEYRERRYFICSIADIDEFATAVRSHGLLRTICTGCWMLFFVMMSAAYEIRTRQRTLRR